jgi:hypothetical protein
MKRLLTSIMLMLSLVSCNSGTTCTENCTVYNPTPYYTCEYVWDTLSGNYVYACFWVYYSQDGSSTQELDMVADIAEREELIISKNAQAYADKYQLSYEQGIKIARNVYNFESLQDRTAQDMADFAQKLYGVNTAELISAISSAQVGENKSLDLLIEKASKTFDTSKENMRFIIKDLHKAALEESGIQL